MIRGRIFAELNFKLIWWLSFMAVRSTYQKEHIDGLFGELNSDKYKNLPESEQLHRDAHLAIAYFDSGRDIPDSIDSRIRDLMDKYGPSS